MRSILDIPGLNGKKSAIAGYGLIVVGIGALLTALGDVFTVAGNCMMGNLDLFGCLDGLQIAFVPVVTALAGLGLIGNAHKIEKATS
jgi:hypothetical protein